MLEFVVVTRIDLYPVSINWLAATQNGIGANVYFLSCQLRFNCQVTDAAVGECNNVQTVQAFLDACAKTSGEVIIIGESVEFLPEA
jgi:hypothetical protein